MSSVTTKITNVPFDLIRFELCPKDVEAQFELDAPFQRDVKSRSRMIKGIQKTLLASKELLRPIDICKLPGNDRLTVLDGKHRLFSLSTLPENLRCTIYALRYRVSDLDQATDLFEVFNLTFPVSIQHLMGVSYRDSDPALHMLVDNLPFHVRVPGVTCTNKSAISLNKVLTWLTRSFGDLYRFDRFSKNDMLAALTKEHVQLLADFAMIFEQATECDFDSRNTRITKGWIGFLFRIYIQNQGLNLTDADWSRRIKAMFANSKIDFFIDTPRRAMRVKQYSNDILAALHEPRQPRIRFNIKNRPAISDINSSVGQQGNGSRSVEEILGTPHRPIGNVSNRRHKRR